MAESKSLANPIEETSGSLQPARNSRRSFLAKLTLGAAAVAALSIPLSGLFRRGGSKTPGADQEFPGPDSIFHPASDPRQDPRRNQ